VLAWSVFGMWVMGQFGTAAMAGNNFMFQYMKVSFMPAFGISVAVTALVGRYIGMGRPDVAAQRANLAFTICAAYMLSCGLVFFFARFALISFFSRDALVVRYGAILLTFGAIYQFFDALYIVYNGALRGAGDTFVPAVATAGLNWTMTVGLAYFVAHYFPRFGVAGPWTSASLYGMILGTFIWLRFHRGAWKGIHLEADSNVENPSARLSLVET
jgi:MATE family multidrug resistance protein